MDLFLKEKTIETPPRMRSGGEAEPNHSAISNTHCARSGQVPVAALPSVFPAHVSQPSRPLRCSVVPDTLPPPGDSIAMLQSENANVHESFGSSVSRGD